MSLGVSRMRSIHANVHAVPCARTTFLTTAVRMPLPRLLPFRWHVFPLRIRAERGAGSSSFANRQDYRSSRYGTSPALSQMSRRLSDRIERECCPQTRRRTRSVCHHRQTTQPPHSLSSQFRVFGTHRTILRGKRPCPARLDHRNRYSPLTNTVSNRRSSIAEHGPDNTCNHPRMSKGKTALNVRFGKRLGALRKEQGWTFVYLSEHSGLAKGFLHALEQGTQEPCLNTLDILAKSFEMTICDFMRGV